MAYDLLHIFRRLGTVPTNIILVGAWEGSEVANFLTAGVSNVYLFEAEPNAISVLQQTYGQDSRIQIFVGAVAAKPGQFKNFYILNHGSSSLLEPNLAQLKRILPDFRVEDEIIVETITLDSSLKKFWEQWNGKELETLLILDIQGGELEAVMGAEELLERIGWIQAEVSTSELYQGQNTLAQLDEFLKAYGFTRVSTRIYPDRKHGDALYFRRELVTKLFRVAMKVEDLHWNLARTKPAWLPSLSDYMLGRLILKIILGGRSE